MPLKISRLSRFNKIVGLGANVLSKSIQGALTAKNEIDTRLAQARAVTKTLSELKGASMKFGQMLSIQGEAFLPREITEILSALQQAAPAFSAAEMNALLRAELQANYNFVAHFENQSLAAASIGQVHRGRLTDGREVVFKIQYPGIASAIDSEISLLKILILPLFKIYGNNDDLAPIIEEVRDLLKQEVDYRQELEYLNFFHEKLSGDERFIVPKAYDQLTTSRVITLSYEKGQSFKIFTSQEHPSETRNKLGHDIFELLLDEIFKYQLVQTDPNFGNYLIRGVEGVTKTVLLDFGSCRRYARAFTDEYRIFLKAVTLEDRRKVFEVSTNMGLIGKDENAEAKEIFYDLCRLAISPFTSAEPFDFQNVNYQQQVSQLSLKLMRNLKVLPAPKELIFLNRKWGGVYNYCRALKVNASFRESLEKALLI